MFTLIFPLLLSLGTSVDARLQQRALTGLQRSNIPGNGFFDPTAGGGAMLTSVPNTFPPGLGEPINIIISANSDPDVLVDSADNGGLRNYFKSFGFSSECLNQHIGADQEANLGDGNGFLNETAVIRWDFLDPIIGTCIETIDGGDHFRYWVQNGKDANSGAIFIAASYELPLVDEHDIICNGYNLARDWLVGNTTSLSGIIDTPALVASPPPTFVGTRSQEGFIYTTTVVYTSGLLSNTSTGINHYITVGCNGINAIDGLVAVMEVHITGRPNGSGAAIPAITRLYLLLPTVLVLASVFFVL